jgi:ribosome-binding factor A
LAKGYRRERINETIKEVISELILYQIKDPRVGMVTITGARISSDLSSARVYFSVMGDEAVRAESLAGLKSAANFLRRQIGQELDLRMSPELNFVYDNSLDRAERIERKLRDVGMGPSTRPSDQADHEAKGQEDDETGDR